MGRNVSVNNVVLLTLATAAMVFVHGNLKALIFSSLMKIYNGRIIIMEYLMFGHDKKTVINRRTLKILTEKIIIKIK